VKLANSTNKDCLNDLTNNLFHSKYENGEKSLHIVCLEFGQSPILDKVLQELLFLRLYN